jgi:16S rRNA G966 N2-methylase RsmD
VQGMFDLILADPPYAGEEAAAFLPLAAGLLAADGRAVLERESRGGPVAGSGLEHFRTAGYGRSSLDFFRLQGSGPASSGPPGPGG